MSGRKLKDHYLKDIENFLPDYLGEKSLANKTEAQQIQAEENFVAMALSSGIAVKEG